MIRRRARPLRLEVVEDRCLPSTLYGGPEPVRREGPRLAHGPVAPAARHAGRVEPAADGDSSSAVQFPVVTVPTPPELPSPREVVERVIDVLLPVGGPLAGVVPFESEALDAAANLLAKLPSLAPDGDAQDGLASPERWAWVTAGVLVA